MGSRKTGSEAEKVYQAAQKWTFCALRTDDSLFTPGKSIWSSQWLKELRKRFLDEPDVPGSGFYGKLKTQLEDSPPEVYQLMGETLYVFYLPYVQVGNKRKRIEDVLGWSPEPVQIPKELIASLQSGFIGPGQAMTTVQRQVGSIVESVEQWKEQAASEQRQLLNDPWTLKEFLATRRFRGRLFANNPNAQYAEREALLHLVHPDSFESIISTDTKGHIVRANAFAHYITEPTDNVDRKLAQIRRGLEARLGRDFDFYDPNIQARWGFSSDLWDEFVRRAKVMVDAGIIEMEGEEKYKSEIGEKLAAAREAILKTSPDWPQLLRAGLTGFESHPLPWQTSDRFRKWIDASSNNAQALQEFWAEGSLSVTDRVRRFSSALPRDVASRPGGFTNLTSVLLMGLDVESYPPFKITAFREAYERTGYDMPEQGADEAALYEHALGFLDRLIDEASKRRLTLRHRLDAQTIAYRTIVASLPEPPLDEEDDPTETQPPPPAPALDLPSLATKLHLPVEFLQEIETLLEDKRQVIFQGPPGTGKTFVAQKLARHLAGADERVTLVQFHPSYAYEDFVQGYRPALVDEQPGFELRDGPLLRAAERARTDSSGAKHFLVVDEINRGNIAKVFGELYFLLEYRNHEMLLQYADRPFSMPDNLYIIGTMNTADRSIALVDLALRRRFYFVMFHPDEEPVKGVLRRWLSDRAPDMEWVTGVVELANEKLSDDRHAAIGPSYFMKDGLDEDMVKRAWKHSVLPYIEERRFGGDEVSEEFDLERLRREAASVSSNDEIVSDINGGTTEDRDGEGE